MHARPRCYHRLGLRRLGSRHDTSPEAVNSSPLEIVRTEKGSLEKDRAEMKWDLWQPTSLLESEPKKHFCFFFISHTCLSFDCIRKRVIFWLPNTDRALFRLCALSVGSKPGLCVHASELSRRFCRSDSCRPSTAVGHHLIQVFIRQLAQRRLHFLQLFLGGFQTLRAFLLFGNGLLLDSFQRAVKSSWRGIT